MASSPRRSKDGALMKSVLGYVDSLHEYDSGRSGGLPAVEQRRTGAVYDQQGGNSFGRKQNRYAKDYTNRNGLGGAA